MNFSVLKNFLVFMIFLNTYRNQSLYTGSDFIDQKLQELLGSIDMGTVVTGRSESIILPEGTIEKVFVDEKPVVVTGADKLDENALSSKIGNSGYSEQTLQKIADFIDPLAKEVKQYTNDDFQRTQVIVQKPYMDTTTPIMMQPTIVQLGPDGKIIGQVNGMQQNENVQQQNQTQAQQVYQQQLAQQNQQSQQQTQQVNYQQQVQNPEELYQVENPEQYFQDIINESYVGSSNNQFSN